MLSEADAAPLSGFVVTRSVRAASPLTVDLFRPLSEAGGSRLMSLPVEPDHAAGGQVEVGDVVDVISVVDGRAEFVVLAAEVVLVPAADASGFGGGRADFLVLAVDASTALAISEALDAGPVHVVRSTGAPSPVVDRSRRPCWSRASHPSLMSPMHPMTA